MNVYSNLNRQLFHKLPRKELIIYDGMNNV